MSVCCDHSEMPHRILSGGFIVPLDVEETRPAQKGPAGCHNMSGPSWDCPALLPLQRGNLSGVVGGWGLPRVPTLRPGFQPAQSLGLDRKGQSFSGHMDFLSIQSSKEDEFSCTLSLEVSSSSGVSLAPSCGPGAGHSGAYHVLLVSMMPFCTRVLHAEPQEKFPTSSLKARYFLLSPHMQTVCLWRGPVLVLAAGHPSSHFRFWL
eukprot:bmy_15256T0